MELTPKELERIILADGWKFKNAKGDHFHYIPKPTNRFSSRLGLNKARLPLGKLKIGGIQKRKEEHAHETNLSRSF